VEKAANAVNPTSAKAICATDCIVIDTVMHAAASRIGAPRCARWRAMTTGPPIWPAGSKLLTDSPAHRALSVSMNVTPGAASTAIAYFGFRQVFRSRRPSDTSTAGRETA
jgi:hypothetical protein